MAASGKRFTIDRQGDPVEFFSWLANTLHTDLTGGKRKRHSGAARPSHFFFLFSLFFLFHWV